METEVQLAVEQLHARYAHALDEDRLEDWPGFFTENGVYRIATAENEARGLPLPVLYAESRAMLRDRVQSLRHANIYEPQRYRHMVSSTIVAKVDATHVKSVSNFLVIRIMENGETLLFASGRYLDRILIPEMQYEERVVVCDSRRFDTLLAIPLQVNATEFNKEMNSLKAGASLQNVRDLFGLPLAHVPASVFQVKPGSEMRQAGLNFSFPVELATEYLVYRHPTRRRMLKILGFRDGLFCGASQQTYTSAAEGFMLRQIQSWREQSLSPLMEG